MVLFNYSTKEITAKIVYYGPGLCGKTTNLQYIHSKLDTKSRGKLLSLATETDRTLFFDFLPLDLGKVSGFHVRFQLYTVPGQVHYNATRRMVLKGVDAVVFVADSQAAMLDHNRESFENLKENLLENGYKPGDVPLYIQLNKRDLPNLASPEAILEAMGAPGRAYCEAVATQGDGVFETLKAIIKLSVAKLKTEFNEESLEAPALDAFDKKPAAKVSSEPKPLFNPDTPMMQSPETAAGTGEEAAAAPVEVEGGDEVEEIEVPLAAERGGGAEAPAAAAAGSPDEGVSEEIAEVPLDDEISLDGGMDIFGDDEEGDVAVEIPVEEPAAAVTEEETFSVPVEEPAAATAEETVVESGAAAPAPGAAASAAAGLEALAAEVKALREENRKVRSDVERLSRGLGRLAEALGEIAAGGDGE